MDRRRARTRAAWVLLVGSILAYPPQVAWVIIRNGFDPFEQIMIFWSVLAVWLVAADLLTTSQVREEQGEATDAPADSPEAPGEGRLRRGTP